MLFKSWLQNHLCFVFPPFSLSLSLTIFRFPALLSLTFAHLLLLPSSDRAIFAGARPPISRRNSRKTEAAMPSAASHRVRESSSPASASTGGGGGQRRRRSLPRLVIKDMMLRNFKSYAGEQRVGPFHKVSVPSGFAFFFRFFRNWFWRWKNSEGKNSLSLFSFLGGWGGDWFCGWAREGRIGVESFDLGLWLCFQSFSAVVGPNGSGKSNVIDAMLFVFGKRAKQVICLHLF